jgi:hypothetical protein
MAHGVYDERGKLILETGSEMRAFLTAMERQTQGVLTTVLLGGSAEVVFVPMLRGGMAEKGRALSWTEERARIAAEIGLPPK